MDCRPLIAGLACLTEERVCPGPAATQGLSGLAGQLAGNLAEPGNSLGGNWQLRLQITPSAPGAPLPEGIQDELRAPDLRSLCWPGNRGPLPGLPCRPRRGPPPPRLCPHAATSRR